MYRSLRLIGISALAAGVTACGGGSDSSETGTVSFGVTDAPATEFSNVTVAFTEIRLKPEDGDWISFPLVDRVFFRRDLSVAAGKTGHFLMKVETRWRTYDFSIPSLEEFLEWKDVFADKIEEE